MLKRRLITMRWTCSDYVHHSHRWKWAAWLCGWMQYLWALRHLRVGL